MGYKSGKQIYKVKKGGETCFWNSENKKNMIKIYETSKNSETVKNLKCEKTVQHHLPSRKFLLTLHWYFILILSEGLKFDKSWCWYMRKWNTHSLLVSMQTVTAIVSISVDLPHSALNRSTTWSSYASLGVHIQRITYPNAEVLAYPCTLLHDLQYPGNRNSLEAHALIKW